MQVPRRLDRALGLLKYVYLGLAILFAVKPALARDFLICRFDPFVGFFRRTGAPHMLIMGGVFLLAGMFIGRPYCRYLCPYGGLLAWCTRLARRGVTITPDKELDCGSVHGSLPLWRDREDARRPPQLSVLRPMLRLLPRAESDKLVQIGHDRRAEQHGSQAVPLALCVAMLLATDSFRFTQAPIRFQDRRRAQKHYRRAPSPQDPRRHRGMAADRSGRRISDLRQ